MLTIIENYCVNHNLKFSTDPEPRKCKTNCITFLKRQRPLPDVILCGNRFPWVDHGVHLGNNFRNSYDGMKADVMIKRAQFVQKSCELQQEFSFAHPNTKIQINNIFNCHFTGSPLWDLSSNEVEHLEKSWNVSLRKMMNLPLTTHKYLIEPLSGTSHLRKILAKRFVSFVRQIENYNKVAAKQLLNVIRDDTQTVTGNNSRLVLRSINRWSLKEVKASDFDKIWYYNIEEKDQWKVNMIKEISSIKMSEYLVEGFTDEEINDILVYLCSS